MFNDFHDGTRSLQLESFSTLIILPIIFFQVRTIVKPGCSQEVLKAALSVMASVTDVLSAMSSTSFNSQTPL